MATIVELAEFSPSRYGRRFDRGGVRGEVVLFTGVQYERESSGVTSDNTDRQSCGRRAFDSGSRLATDLDEPPAAS